MKLRSARRQHGISFLGLVVLIAVLAVVGVITAQVVPSVMEQRAIQAAIEKAKEGETPDQVRRSFERTAEVEGIRSISSKDLEITKNDAGKVQIEYAYDRQFRLVGPAFLLIKYSGRSN